MNKLKQNQLGPFCTFCPPKTNRAVWREHGFAGSFACDEHRNDLRDLEKKKFEEDQHTTEADARTWMRL